MLIAQCVDFKSGNRKSKNGYEGGRGGYWGYEFFELRTNKQPYDTDDISRANFKPIRDCDRQGYTIYNKEFNNLGEFDV